MTASNPKPRLALILGSTRPGRMCTRIARWISAQVHLDGRFELDVVDPLELGFGESGPPRVGELRPRIAQADAFLVVSPEYNHGYPAPLKQLLDSLYDEWKAKPVAFVGYGGMAGGARAVEQLRLVFAELHAVSVRDTVSFVNAGRRFTEDGSLEDPAAPTGALALVLRRLRWWSDALAQARRRDPYDPAVLTGEPA